MFFGAMTSIWKFYYSPPKSRGIENPGCYWFSQAEDREAWSH